MKTIAITISPAAVEQLDRLVAAGGWKSRSQLIRGAIELFTRQLARAREEEREREILYRQRRRLGRQAAALIREQARP